MREATLSDLDRVVELGRALGMGSGEDARRLRERWEWIWTRNPALALPREPMAPGWVMEAGNRIVGFFGNVARRYRLGARDLLVAVGSGWAVRKECRAHTNLLATAFFNDKRADIFMGSTLIVPSARIFERFAGLRMPEASYVQVPFWVFDESGVSRAALGRKGVPPLLSAPAAPALALALKAARVWKNHRPGRMAAGLTPEIIPLDAVGPEFDELWERKTAERDRFYAYRRAEDLRWHFQLAARDGTALIIGCRNRGRLDGYLALKQEDAAASRLKRMKIADLFVAGDDPGVVDALLGAAYDAARERGAHVLELIGLTPPLRARALRSRPFVRAYAHFPFYYKAGSAALAQALLPADAWYPTMYDGDTSL
ncbi:MAG TPA: hypothetical protein VM658_07275 [bacterium]|nr:hypothetical protein [bacterium]